MPTKLEKGLRDLFESKFTNRMDEQLLRWLVRDVKEGMSIEDAYEKRRGFMSFDMRDTMEERILEKHYFEFMNDIMNGLSFEEAKKKHYKRLSKEVKDSWNDWFDEKILLRREEKLRKEIREDIEFDESKKRLEVYWDKEDAKRKQEYYEVNRKSLINGHNQVAEALWNKKLKAKENPIGKGQAFSLSPKIEGVLIWKYLTFKPKIFFFDTLNTAYVKLTQGTDYYPIIDDVKKSVELIRKGKLKKSKRRVISKNKFTFRELLCLLKHSESLSVIQEGMYKRRDFLGDSINIEFKSDLSWLTIKVKHPSRLPDGKEVVQDNGKFLVKFTVLANHDFFEDMKSNKKGGKITANGKGYRMVKS